MWPRGNTYQAIKTAIASTAPASDVDAEAVDRLHRFADELAKPQD